ncbi:tetratricopeptide repeat protein [bacterium]|nr:tetratricopeptide repeat protein [bacterium]
MKANADTGRLAESSGFTPMRGRARELTDTLELTSRWLAEGAAPATDPPARRGVNVLEITGQPGTGKTRFALELQRRLRQQVSLTVIQFKCRQPAQIADLAAAVIAVTRDAIGKTGADWRVLCAEQAVVLGGEYAERLVNLDHVYAQLAGQTDAEPEPDTSAGRSEQSLLAVLRGCLELVALATGCTPLLFIDDFQWVGSLKTLLASLFDGLRLPGRPLIICAYRTGHPGLAELLDAQELHRLELAYVSGAAGRQIIQDVLKTLDYEDDCAWALPPAKDGLPLYYQQHGGLIAEADAAVVKGHLAEIGRAARAGGDESRAVILRRYENLPAADQAWLQLCAVAGHDLPVAALKSLYQLELPAVALQSIYHLELPAPDTSLGPAAAAMLGGVAFRALEAFQHDAALEAVYATIPGDTRRRLHELVAAELGARLKPGSLDEINMLPMLCRHLESAGLTEALHRRCCELLTLMAQTGKLETWDEWHARAEACGAGPSPYLRRADAHRQRNQLDLAAFRACLAQALELCAPDQHDELAGRLHGEIASCYMQEGANEDAERHFEQSIALLRRAQAERCLAMTLANVGIMLHRQGRHADARRCYEEALALTRRTGDNHTQAAVLGYLATLFMDLADLEAARQHYEQSLAWFERFGDLVRIATTLSDLGTVYRELEKHGPALEYYSRAARIQEALNEQIDLSVTMVNTARLLRNMGELEQSVEKARVAIALAEATGCAPVEGMGLMELGETLRVQGELSEALEVLNKAHPILLEAGFDTFAAVCDCFLAKTYAQTGDQEKAREHATAAKDAYVQAGSPRDLDLYPEVLEISNF